MLGKIFIALLIIVLSAIIGNYTRETFYGKPLFQPATLRTIKGIGWIVASAWLIVNIFNL